LPYNSGFKEGKYKRIIVLQKISLVKFLKETSLLLLQGPVVQSGTSKKAEKHVPMAWVKFGFKCLLH